MAPHFNGYFNDESSLNTLSKADAIKINLIVILGHNLCDQELEQPEHNTETSSTGSDRYLQLEHISIGSEASLP